MSLHRFPIRRKRKRKQAPIPCTSSRKSSFYRFTLNIRTEQTDRDCAMPHKKTSGNRQIRFIFVFLDFRTIHPNSETMIIDDIALTLHPNVGPKTAIALMQCFGSAEQLFAATEEEIIARSRLKPALARSIYRKEYHSAAEKELSFARKNRIRIIPCHSPEYPRMLLECNDYPHVLYAKGQTDLNSGHWLSVVGTRHVTPYGLKACDRLIGGLRELFPDLVVVSGLAYGVDIAAHRAALHHNAVTVGVLAHPLTRIYPPRHTESTRRMVDAGGALLSEYNTTCEPDKSGFVQRNRIIAGLCMGTLIVESAERGGSLITADMAYGYDRTVMAVPGRMDDPYSAGTNRLIRTLKAQTVCLPEDIAYHLNWETVPRKTETRSRPDPEPSLFGKEDPAIIPVSGKVLSFLENGEPVTLEELSLRCGMPVYELATVLLDLEFAGKIRSLPGKAYQKIL